nr:hypothetical protein [Tanacetum cinerariifolium]
SHWFSLEMFTEEHAPDYSSPPNFDVYLDDFLENKSYADNFMMILSTPRERKSKRILIHKKSVTIITRVAQEKKIAISYASLVFKDFEPPFRAPLFFKDVPKSRMLLPFSTENKEKVFKPGIHTSGKDCPDCKVFYALSIVLYIQELHILSFILGIQYPNLID